MKPQSEKLEFIEAIANPANGRGAGGVLTERLFEAFRRELSAKRWQEGEFLPLPGEVAEAAGVSKASVSRSYDKLARQGYIRRTKRKGSEVISTRPISTAVTRLGILLCNPGSARLFRSEAYAQKLAFACLEHARQRGVESEISILSAGQMARPCLEAMELFEKIPNGIMAVGPAPCLKGAGGEALPVMYLHRSANDLRPCVMGDSRSAIRLLTERAIAAGHHNIVFMGDRDRSVESDIRWQFHSEFMREAGLEPNAISYRHSLELSPADLNDWKEWIRRHEKTATCFLSGNRARTAEMLAAASVALGRRMPEDFSLLSYGHCSFISETGESQVESVDHDVGSLIRVGMDILCGQIRGDYEDVISPMVAPRWYSGSTFGPPPNTQRNKK